MMIFVGQLTVLILVLSYGHHFTKVTDFLNRTFTVDKKEQGKTDAEISVTKEKPKRAFTAKKETSPTSDSDKETGTTTDIEIVKKDLLTDTEKMFFKILTEALPECYIFTQVSLGAILRNKTQYWNRGSFSQKMADFIVVNGELDVVAIVELDDRSHDKPKKKQDDEARDTMLNNAGYITIRYDSRNMPDKETIRQDVKV